MTRGKTAFFCIMLTTLIAVAARAAAAQESAASPIAPLGAAAVKPASSANSQDNVPPPLLLDVGDLLDVRVFDTPELSDRLRVDDRGEITLPVAGTVNVKGLTAAQAQSAIEECFRQK